MKSNKEPNANEEEVQKNEPNLKTDSEKENSDAEVKEVLDENEKLLFAELETKNSRIAELENESKDLKETLLRKAAEFENYKRRTENELQNFVKYASESFVLSVLPVYTDFERSMEHIDDEGNSASFKEGIKLLFQKFIKIMEDQGVKKIEAKGQPFDFNFHEALMQKPAEDVPAHTVLDVLEPGFMLKDKVIKHAKVIVSQELSQS